MRVRCGLPQWSVGKVRAICACGPGRLAASCHVCTACASVVGYTYGFSVKRLASQQPILYRPKTRRADAHLYRLCREGRDGGSWLKPKRFMGATGYVKDGGGGGLRLMGHRHRGCPRLRRCCCSARPTSGWPRWAAAAPPPLRRQLTARCRSRSPTAAVSAIE